jgi:murein L,D-transpeptidase YafK
MKVQGIHVRLNLALGLAIATATALYFISSNESATSGRDIARTSLTEALPPVFTDAGPEPLLVHIFTEIENNRLERALARTEQLLTAYPNFRLGHLIMGDLLLARARPLTRFGQGGEESSRSQVADLRDEAIVRLRGYQTKPPTDTIPRYLTQMSAGQKYAVVVDTQKSRLYLYQNDDGRPRFVADYYVTQGKLGAEKTREGDKRTPIGVYHVTANLPKDKLSDLYGSGAFPLNYPNEWDKRQGRDGHGIWLHGTPSDTFSRPPKASDGCVVLTNQDLNKVAKNLQVGLTPVIISNSVEWLSLDDWQNERSELREVFDNWRSDWESRDMKRYSAHYSKRFASEKQDYTAWMDQKQRVNAGKEWIKVEADNISMFRNPGREEYVVISFEQDYKSNNLSNQMRKRQYWAREDGQWKIIYEGAA